jgi:hypothetical protein
MVVRDMMIRDKVKRSLARVVQDSQYHVTFYHVTQHYVTPHHVTLFLGQLSGAAQCAAKAGRCFSRS